MDSMYQRSVDLYIDTHEAGGVVVTDGLGVTEGLEYRVGLHNLVLQVLGNKIG